MYYLKKNRQVKYISKIHTINLNIKKNYVTNKVPAFPIIRCGIDKQDG